MAIPLPALMRAWRERDFERGGGSSAQRLALKLWAVAAKRPRLYHTLARTFVPLLAWLARGRGRFRLFPFAGSWTATRDLAVPEGRTFQALYRDRWRRGRS